MVIKTRQLTLLVDCFHFYWTENDHVDICIRWASLRCTCFGAHIMPMWSFFLYITLKNFTQRLACHRAYYTTILTLIKLLRTTDPTCQSRRIHPWWAKQFILMPRRHLSGYFPCNKGDKSLKDSLIELFWIPQGF